ncbi:hypothetical protein FQA39_LY02661 [Lamprigera yunnana]|nr:hypothetical protein FQA39_LY02661 [Lamprigera yunnana]
MAQLFMIDVHFRKIIFLPHAVDVPTLETLKIDVQFADIVKFTVPSEDIRGFIQYYNIPYQRYFNLDLGRSVVFISTPRQILSAFAKYPLELSMETPESTTAVMPWQPNFYKMLERLEKIPNVIPRPSTHKCDVKFVNKWQKKFAHLWVFVRLSSFGKCIQTQFQVIPETKIFEKGVAKQYFLKGDQTQTVFCAQTCFDEEEQEVDEIIPVAALCERAHSETFFKRDWVEPEGASIKELNQIVCKNKDCPGARRFAKFGIGPAASGIGLGTLFDIPKSVDLPIHYGMSNTYGAMENYGPFGIYIKSDDESSENSLECDCNFDNSENTMSQCCCPLRLKGGASDDNVNVVPQPVAMCKDLMQSFDKVLNAYKQVIGPCHHGTCSLSTNVVDKICKNACYGRSENDTTNPVTVSQQTVLPPINQNEISACGVPSCPFSRHQTSSFDKLFQEARLKSGCGIPMCPVLKQKLGTATPDEIMQMQFVDSTCASEPCGLPKCPLPPPTLKSLQPIHWDCPDPLPKGPCRNPQCPFKPKELQYTPCSSPPQCPPRCSSSCTPCCPPDPCCSPSCGDTNCQCTTKPPCSTCPSCFPPSCADCPSPLCSKPCCGGQVCSTAKCTQCCFPSCCPQPGCPSCGDPCTSPTCCSTLPCCSPACIPPQCCESACVQPRCCEPSCAPPQCCEVSCSPRPCCESACTPTTCLPCQPPPCSPCCVPTCNDPTCPYINPTCPMQCLGSQPACPNPCCPFKCKLPPKKRKFAGKSKRKPSEKVSDVLCSNPNCPIRQTIANVLGKEDIFPCDLQVGDAKLSIDYNGNRGDNEQNCYCNAGMPCSYSVEPVCSKKTKEKGKKRKSGKYLYKLGDLYPGVHIGHRECILPGKSVPAKMGWAWNVYDASVGLKPRRGWRPGAINRRVAKMIMAHRRAKGLQMLQSQSAKDGKRSKTQLAKDYDSDSDASVAPKATLRVKKKDGAYVIIMNPLKDPETMGENENPYMNCSPLQFKITKNKKVDENQTCFCNEPEPESSSDSELDIEFTPPAGIIRPDKLKRKGNTAHTESQYNEEDFNPPDPNAKPPEKKNGAGKKKKQKKC